VLNLTHFVADVCRRADEEEAQRAAASTGLTAAEILLGPKHRRPLQATILNYLASVDGAPSYDIAAGADCCRDSIDDCMVERLIPAGLVKRTKRRQTIAGKIFRAWHYRLTAAARQKLEAAK
jgi:hypothetical protein